MAPAQSLAEHIRFLRRRAADLRSIAAKIPGEPTVAGELRRMGSELETEADELEQQLDPRS